MNDDYKRIGLDLIGAELKPLEPIPLPDDALVAFLLPYVQARNPNAAFGDVFNMLWNESVERADALGLDVDMLRRVFDAMPAEWKRWQRFRAAVTAVCISG